MTEGIEVSRIRLDGVVKQAQAALPLQYAAIAVDRHRLGLPRDLVADRDDRPSSFTMASSAGLPSTITVNPS